jgi:hypothetical protein
LKSSKAKHVRRLQITFAYAVQPIAGANPALCCKLSMMRTLIFKVLGGSASSR